MFAAGEDQDDGHAPVAPTQKRHAEAAPHFAHRMRAAAEFGGDQRRGGAGQADQRVGEQVEDEDAERRRRQIDRAEPRDEDHIDRRHRHLEQVGRDERRRQPRKRAQLLAGRIPGADAARVRAVSTRPCRRA